MTTDRIGLNTWIKGEIRHQSVANRLHNFQSVTNPLAFGSDQNKWIESMDFLYTPMACDTIVLSVNGNGNHVGSIFIA